jgi:hypothetical protein
VQHLRNAVKPLCNAVQPAVKHAVALNCLAFRRLLVLWNLCNRVSREGFFGDATNGLWACSWYKL